MKYKARYYTVKLYIDGEENEVKVTWTLSPILIKKRLEAYFKIRTGGYCSNIFYFKRDKKYSFLQRYKWYWHLKSAIIDEKERIRKMVRIYSHIVTNNALNSLPRKHETQH